MNIEQYGTLQECKPLCRRSYCFQHTLKLSSASNITRSFTWSGSLLPKLDSVSIRSIYEFIFYTHKSFCGETFPHIVKVKPPVPVSCFTWNKRRSGRRCREIGRNLRRAFPATRPDKAMRKQTASYQLTTEHTILCGGEANNEAGISFYSDLDFT